VNSSVQCEVKRQKEKVGKWLELQTFAGLHRDGEAFLT